MTLLQPLFTDPFEVTLATTDNLPVTCDTTELLQIGESPSNPVVTITGLPAPGVEVQGLASPTIYQNLIIQQVPGSLLYVGNFQVRWVFEASPGVIWTVITTIVVPV